MRVLLDTDAFCKLASADLLEPSLEILGCQLSDCARLRALPYMLGRGRLHEQYGDEASAALVLAAEKVPIMSPPGDEWLDRLAQVEAIDPGEAQIFAKAAEGGQMVIDRGQACAPGPRGRQRGFRGPFREGHRLGGDSQLPL